MGKWKSVSLYACPACGELRDWITINHMKTHEVSTRHEFIQKYGEPVMQYYFSKSPKVVREDK